MEKRKKNIHRGELLQKVVKESGISITLLMVKIGYKTRGSFYAHINDPELSFDILFKYGKALHYNFGEHFAEMFDLYVQDSSADYKKEPLSLDHALVVIEKLKEQHYNLLVKYEQLLEKMEEMVKQRK